MANNGHETDLFVLAMTYDANSLFAPYLASFDSGTWQRATLDDIGSANDQFVGFGAWSGDKTLGDWGIDPIGHTVWAVLDHDGNFAAVPEPSTLILFGVGAVGMMAYAWRKRRPT